jgi:REP element-mobilizing transposase RayT
VGTITGPAIGRVSIAHQTNFFTVVTYWRRPLLTHAESRRTLRSIIAQVRRAYPFQIEAGVLLPEHLRCIWTLPPGDADFLKRWRLTKPASPNRHVLYSARKRGSTPQKPGTVKAPFGCHPLVG